MGHIQNLLTGKGNGKKEDPPKPLWKCLLCEFIGTTVLIYIGCGVGLHINDDDERSLIATAICWGFVIATLGQTLGTYSCDINPAVTLAFLATGKTNVVKAILYIIVQCIGCTVGAALLKGLLPDGIQGRFGITRIAPGVEVWQGLLIEIFITCLLVMTVFGSGDGKRKDLKGSMPVSVGFCAASIILSTSPYTGASMNPARTLGPCIVEGNFDNHWVYWVGPICGGVLGGLIYHHVLRVRGDEDCCESAPTTV